MVTAVMNMANIMDQVTDTINAAFVPQQPFSGGSVRLFGDDEGI